MDRVRELWRRVRALPRRARIALAAAVVLTAVAVGLLAWPAGDGGGGDDVAGDTGSTGDAPGSLPSTTLATGGIDIEAPDGWLEIPVPALRFGLAVPPGWEASLLSAEGLGALAGADPVVPDFVENAQAAASSAGVLYAAGLDQEGRVSDVTVRSAPQPGVTDIDGLRAYAAELAAAAGHDDPQIEVVEDAAWPTVRLRFRAGAGEEVAEGTETLVLGPDDFVWSVTVTSDDPASHDELAEQVTGTLAFAPAG